MGLSSKTADLGKTDYGNTDKGSAYNEPWDGFLGSESSLGRKGLGRKRVLVQRALTTFSAVRGMFVAMGRETVSPEGGDGAAKHVKQLKQLHDISHDITGGHAASFRDMCPKQLDMQAGRHTAGWRSSSSRQAARWRKQLKHLKLDVTLPARNFTIGTFAIFRECAAVPEMSFD